MGRRILIGLVLGIVAAVTHAGLSTAAVQGPIKQPVPQEEERQKVREKAQQLFSPADVKDQDDKRKLSAQLLQVGKGSKNVVEQFVLFNMAREQALASEDVAGALDAAGQLDAVFQIDGLQLRARTLHEAIGWNLPDLEKAAVANQTLDLIDATVAGNRLELADPLSKKLSQESRQLRDVDLRKRILAQRKRVVALAQQWAKVQPAVDKLQVAPGDADANLQYGSYLCLAAGDWARGLPHLAKGSDVALKELAQRDLAGPKDGPQQKKLAEDWQQIAQTQADFEPCRQRAGHWYQQAHASGGLNALDRLTIENALKKLGMPLKPATGDVAALPKFEPPKEQPQPDPPAEPQPPANVATFAAPDQSDRLAPANEGDGKFSVAEVLGVSVLVAEKSYLYFRIDDDFLKDLPGNTPVLVRVTLIDAKPQNIDIEYDGHVDDPQVKSDGRYRESKNYQLRGTGRGQMVEFVLIRPRLSNRQNYGADFRIRASHLAVHQVQVIAAPSR